MSLYSVRKPVLPSQKAAAALLIISHDSTVAAIMEETGATAAEVERWVCIVQECAQELFSNQWGNKPPKSPLSKNELAVLQRQLLRLNEKIVDAIEA